MTNEQMDSISEDAFASFSDAEMERLLKKVFFKPIAAEWAIFFECKRRGLDVAEGLQYQLTEGARRLLEEEG